MMACNCQKGTSKTTFYRWTKTDGSTQDFTSQTAAELAVTRYGGTWKVVTF